MTGLDWAQSQADERPVPMSFVGSEGLSSGVPQRSRVHEAGGWAFLVCRPVQCQPAWGSWVWSYQWPGLGSPVAAWLAGWSSTGLASLPAASWPVCQLGWSSAGLVCRPSRSSASCPASHFLLLYFSFSFSYDEFRFSFFGCFVFLVCLVMFRYVWLWSFIVAGIWLCLVILCYVRLCSVIFDDRWLGLVLVGYVWFCVVMFSYVWLCFVMFDSAWLC